MSDSENSSLWALILGGSSGFGLATAKLLASKGFNIFIVHRDLKTNQNEIDRHFDEIRSNGVQVEGINKNAISEEGQSEISDLLIQTLGNKGKIKMLLHSLADGNLGEILTEGEGEGAGELEFDHTINAMGVSFVTWSKLLHRSNLFSDGARIIGITSEGGHKVLPGYSAVSAAKSVLESTCRSMAVEFAKFDITVNLVNAGITDSPALRAMDNHESLLKKAKERNPFNRLTLPEDVANVIYLLSRPEAKWINGEIIRVDGGEQIVY